MEKILEGVRIDDVEDEVVFPGEKLLKQAKYCTFFIKSVWLSFWQTIKKMCKFREMLISEPPWPEGASARLKKVGDKLISIVIDGDGNLHEFTSIIGDVEKLETGDYTLRFVAEIETVVISLEKKFNRIKCMLLGERKIITSIENKTFRVEKFYVTVTLSR